MMNRRNYEFTRTELNLSSSCLFFGLVGGYRPPFPFTLASLMSLANILSETHRISTTQVTTLSISRAEAVLIAGSLEHAIRYLEGDDYECDMFLHADLQSAEQLLEKMLAFCGGKEGIPFLAWAESHPISTVSLDACHEMDAGPLLRALELRSSAADERVGYVFYFVEPAISQLIWWVVPSYVVPAGCSQDAATLLRFYGSRIKLATRDGRLFSFYVYGDTVHVRAAVLLNEQERSAPIEKIRVELSTFVPVDNEDCLFLWLGGPVREFLGTGNPDYPRIESVEWVEDWWIVLIRLANRQLLEQRIDDEFLITQCRLLGEESPAGDTSPTIPTAT